MREKRDGKRGEQENTRSVLIGLCEAKRENWGAFDRQFNEYNEKSKATRKKAPLSRRGKKKKRERREEGTRETEKSRKDKL